ncbi:hypothetical protein L7F22_022358 [Adiantum nelumboides]|nr:hypothetical protein [Adiantum nelumboides]
MDIPLSSDALDVAFAPAEDRFLLATGLISGKVQLIDYGELQAKRERGALKRAEDVEVDDEDDDDDGGGEESADEDEQGARTSAPRRGASGHTKLWTSRPSQKSCRGVAFSHDSRDLWTIAKDGSIVCLDVEHGGQAKLEWKKAHAAAPSRLLPLHPTTTNNSGELLATGDDDGVVAIWDPRRPFKGQVVSEPASLDASTSSAVRTYSHHYDWITDMLWCEGWVDPRTRKKSREEEEEEKRKKEKKRRRKDRKRGQLASQGNEDDEQGGAQRHRERLVVTSGDGSLSVIDLRSGGKAGVDVSEDQEDELLSIASVKGGNKLVVGTQLGMLSLWSPSRGMLDHVDRIPGHPASVDTLCTLDRDTILTGSSDGLVRVVQILPHKLLGIVADHGGMPVERIVRKGSWLASIGHGPEVKLTDVSELLEPGSEDEEGEDDDGRDASEDDDEDEERDDGGGMRGVGMGLAEAPSRE